MMTPPSFCMRRTATSANASNASSDSSLLPVALVLRSLAEAAISALKPSMALVALSASCCAASLAAAA
jgi:hypothetical protein